MDSLKHQVSRSLGTGLSGALWRVRIQAWKVSTTQRCCTLSQSNHPCDRLAHCADHAYIRMIRFGVHQIPKFDLGPMTVVQSGPASPGPQLDSLAQGIDSSQLTAYSSNRRQLHQTRTRPGGGLLLRSCRGLHVSAVAESGTAAV